MILYALINWCHLSRFVISSCFVLMGSHLFCSSLPSYPTRCSLQLSLSSSFCQVWINLPISMHLLTAFFFEFSNLFTRFSLLRYPKFMKEHPPFLPHCLQKISMPLLSTIDKWRIDQYHETHIPFLPILLLHCSGIFL